jgi:hypothetical protein
MKRKFHILQIIFLFTLLFTFNASAFSLGSLFNFSQEKKPQKSHVTKSVDERNSPMHIKVGTYILHVGKYDPQQANIQMDFYLIFQCKPTCNNMNFEIMNATNANIHLVEKQKNFSVYRIQADLSKPDNLRNYPFDNHVIDIIIEDRQMTIDKMVFEADPTTTAFDSDLNIVGFHLLPTWTADVNNHFYSVFKRTFSSYRFSMHIMRPKLAGILKGILPALIIICCAFLALFMKIKHVSQRFSIATSTLVAAVVFHLNLTASLPPLGYMTYADMFMLINYVCLFAILIEVVTTTYCIDTKHGILADRINITCAWLIPIVWIVTQIIVWLAFN